MGMPRSVVPRCENPNPLMINGPNVVIAPCKYQQNGLASLEKEIGVGPSHIRNAIGNHEKGQDPDFDISECLAHLIEFELSIVNACAIVQDSFQCDGLFVRR